MVNPSSAPSMVIRTEYRGQRYSMGSSDPLPAGFEIWFGGLNFQATGNGYLMRLTNRVATTPTPASTDAAGPSVPRRRGRSGQCSRQARSERRHAARIAAQRDAPASTTTAAPAGECSVSEPRLPISLRGAATASDAKLTSTRRCTGFPLAAMFWLPGTLVPPPATSHP
jgi:hypothetical protein